VWDARRIRQRLRALGVRRRLTVPTRPDHGWEGLTPAELAVALHVGRGMTNREAADTLFVSPHTVGAHMRHVFEKLEIRSRVELAREVSARERPATSG
jgi:DNA-binding CsgD family transcriptional regulator